MRQYFWSTYRRAARFANRTGMRRLQVGGRPLAAIVSRPLKRLLGMGLPRHVPVEGFQFRYRLKTGEPHLEFLAPDYETNLRRVFLEVIRPGDCVVDAGANIGYFSLLAAARTGTAGHVYAFEPDPANFDLLQENIRSNRLEARVATRCCALGPSSGGVVPLYRGISSSVTSQFVTPFSDRFSSIEAPVLSLDDCLREVGWPPVRLVKIDVEGAELGVVRGARELIQRNPSLCLIVEFSPTHQGAAGCTAEAFFAAMVELGLTRIHRIATDLRPLQNAGALAAEVAALPPGGGLDLCCWPASAGTAPRAMEAKGGHGPG